MKALLTFAFGGISLIGTLFTILSAGNANAAFTCGPHLATYSVRSLNGWSGQGVRCVRFYNSSILLGYWYGEGYWGSKKYRHIGEIFGAVAGLSDASSASDIFGNGEDTNGHFPQGSLKFSSSGGALPQRIRVTGAWNEEWILEADKTVRTYTSPLGLVRTCGSNFITFVAQSAVRGTTGGGVRCAIDRKSGYYTWFGQGSWNGRSYTHIGSSLREPNGSTSHEAFDICEPSISSACGVFVNKSIILTPFNDLVRVSGAWNETWIRK